MRIESRAPIAPGAAARQRPAGGARFAPEAHASQTPSQTAPAGGLIALDAVLALQANEGQAERERRQRAARRGYDLLDALDQLKIALLSGRVPVDQIGRLTRQMAAAGGPTGDPGLDDLLAHIELRARVELAKLAPREPSARRQD